MLGIAALAFIFAYGRMHKSFGARPFMVLAAIALALTYMTALIVHQPLSVKLLFPAALQFVFQALVYVAGAALGRWLDSRKDAL